MSRLKADKCHVYQPPSGSFFLLMQTCSAKWPKNRNFLAAICFILKCQAHQSSLHVKPAAAVYFQTVSGLFTTRNSATFE